MKELIKKIKGNQHLSLEAEEYIFSISKEKTFPKGTILIRQGQQVNKVYFVTDGCLRSYCIEGFSYKKKRVCKKWFKFDLQKKLAIVTHTNARNNIL